MKKKKATKTKSNKTPHHSPALTQDAFIAQIRGEVSPQLGLTRVILQGKVACFGIAPHPVCL